MAHLDGQTPLSKKKDTYVAGISSIEKLEAALKEQQALLAEAEANITTLSPCYQRYQASLNLKWHSRKMIDKVERKLKNLKRVKKADFKLKTWYRDGGWDKEAYIYPIRVTPAGRVEVIKIKRHEKYHTYNYYYNVRGNAYEGSYWNVVHENIDSKDLERVAPLTVLVTVGNLNRILTHFLESEFYSEMSGQAFFFMNMKDNEELEALETHPKLPKKDDNGDGC